jgi:hypothetical protein
MPDYHDVNAFARLDREIKRRLWGNEKEAGLYRALLGGDWDSVCRIRGLIFAYEDVIKVMHEIAQAMNNEDRRAEGPPQQPPRMN